MIVSYTILYYMGLARVPGLGFRAQSSGFRLHGLGLMMQALGPRVQD